MKKNLCILAAVLVCCCGNAFGWGKTGHDAIACIAESNLTPKARAAVEKYLGGRSIVYYASWMDGVRFTKEYRASSAWHSASVDDRGRYIASEKGDAVSTVERILTTLKDYRSRDDSTVVVSIRMLVHLVGDIHCPSHAKSPEYQDFTFWYDNKELRYHSFWDSPALEMNHNWSMMDYQRQLDRCSVQERDAISAGTPRQWIEASARDCAVTREWMHSGEKIEKKQAGDLMLRVQTLADEQVLKAGYRLARVLNAIFG